MKPILYSLGGAVGLILSVAAYEVFHILRIKRSNDLYRKAGALKGEISYDDLLEDDGWITLHPEMIA